jgi:hypothetical protein
MMKTTKTRLSRRKLLGLAGTAIGASALSGLRRFALAAEPIDLGASPSLTGRFSDSAKYVKEGYDLWAEHVNGKGGIARHPVRVVVYDDESNPDTGRVLAERLIDRDAVLAILGPYSSPVTDAMATANGARPNPHDRDHRLGQQHLEPAQASLEFPGLPLVRLRSRGVPEGPARDRRHVEIRENPKMGRPPSTRTRYSSTFRRRDRIGAEGDGFRSILHGMNPERILIAADAVGLGRAALKPAANHAKERVVFGRPIGQYQGIQHPLAK